MVLTAAQLQTKLASKTSDLTESATFTPQDGAYDPADGSVGAAGTPITGVGVIPGTYQRGLVDGQNIQADDVQLVIPVPVAGLSFTPSENYRVTFDGQAWDIVSVRPSRYRGTVVAYVAQLRRGPGGGE